jgi:hypothetical protein
MSHYFTLDRESFQKLLANAYAVQQSQVDSQSLSAVVEVQRLIAGGNLDVDGALHLIVDRTQNVANATGVAIGLLQTDQLLYRAGSGSAATYIGRSVTATLVVPTDSKGACEILRVENAEIDARIEGAICRQFGAKSLLILPIYHDHAVAGVVEIFFSEAHAFQDSEVRTYRLMAGLAGEAISCAALQTQDKTVAAELPASPHALKARQPAIDPPRGAGMPIAWDSMFAQPPVPTLVVMRWARRVLKYGGRRNIRLAAVAAILVLTCWIAYSHRRPASAIGSSAKSTITGQQAPLPTTQALPAAGSDNLQTMPDRRAGARAATTGFRRVRVGENEVDYIKDDVTVRYFKPKPAPHTSRMGNRVGNNEVAYIGDDVTVRYFMRKPAVASPAAPIGGAAQPASHSPSTPANSIPPKTTR